MPTRNFVGGINTLVWMESRGAPPAPNIYEIHVERPIVKRFPLASTTVPAVCVHIRRDTHFSLMERYSSVASTALSADGIGELYLYVLMCLPISVQREFMVGWWLIFTLGLGAGEFICTLFLCECYLTMSTYRTHDVGFFRGIWR